MSVHACGFIVGIAACFVVQSMTASADGSLECRVKSVGGVPTFVINGKPHSGVCYSTYDCSPDNLQRRVRQFAEAGCDIFNFVVEIAGYGYSRPIWAAPETWDFSDLDGRAHLILEAAPDAMLLPRIYIGAPAWWREENPGEMMLLDNGSTSFGEKLFALPRAGEYPSLASEKWRTDMKRGLETVIEHVEASDYGDRVIGYQLSGQKTEEWYHWSMSTELLGDYSPHMERAFRAWLHDRYDTDEELRAAWRRGDATIETAAIPRQADRLGDRSQTFRDPLTEQHVIDFHRFWSEIMASTIEYFAKVVKDKTAGRKLAGAFYAYTFEFTDLGEDAGHLAVGKLIRSPHVDFVMAPSSYFNRNLPGSPYFRAPVASLNLHGKVFWNDFDQVSYKYYDKLKDDPNLKTWEYQMGLTKTAEEFVWMNRREVGMALAQGAQLAHFDIHGGYYEDPEIMAGVRELVELRKDALSLRNRASAAEILVIADEESEHYLSFRSPILRTLLSEQIAEMPFVAPYDAALLSDLQALDTRRYRMVLVLNAVKLDTKQRQLVRRKLARDGKVVIWLYAPGYIDESGASPDNITRLTRIHVVADGEAAAGGEARWEGRGRPRRERLRLLPGDQFRVEDPEAIPLAVRADDPAKVVAATKDFAEWTSVYSAAAPLTAPLLKRLAADAGVHLYDEDPDHIVFANRHHLTLCADARGGEASIRLPRKTSVRDPATGEWVCRDGDCFTVEMRPKEVRMFFME